ncbi:p-aminobenzoyl-glutamate hydrolase subunit B [Caloramator mitchellensis]|uniref:Peptidase M20 domain-containing protein 2 n=1 Tax=Caloramator mitchellensis TaxID=908809 RepID=A0A0R3K055_CALMK|nr:hypothetical protein [Caloramator mitchellensis]KRQ86772.1 p-aminobenzoyl-glutamate hydrolase subunit B [Caloramator mitchellensis]
MANIDRSLITGYIENKRDKLENLVDMLYHLPLDSNHETNAFNIICDFLNQENFNIEKNIDNIQNTFIASCGSGNKKVAFICEFEAQENGYTNGHNIQCAMNIGAALGFKRVINEIDAQILIYGFPKEEKLPLKISYEHRRLFNGINLIVCGHPGEKTYEGVNSTAMSIMKFDFIGKEASFNFYPNEGISSIVPMIKFLDIIQDLKSNANSSYLLNYTIINNGNEILKIPKMVSCRIAIKANEYRILESVKDNIIETAKFVSRIYGCDINFTVEEDYMPLKKNVELIKIVSHNLKESGITNIHGPLSTALSLDIGNISQKIPTIHPYIEISQGEVYGTVGFRDSTIKKYAKDMMIKASCALALTALDFITKN